MDKFLSSVDKTRCTIYRIGIYPLDSLICPPNHVSQNFGELTTLPQSGFVLFYSKKIQGLFQDSDWFFQDSKFHFTPLILKILKSIYFMVYKHFW